MTSQIVFETPDIEDEVVDETRYFHPHDNEPESKFIISQKIDPNTSFTKFSNERFSTRSKDYSDSVAKPQRVTKRFNEETPYQRYSRLKGEITQLLSDIETSSFDEVDEEVDPSELVEHLKKLQLELSNVDALKLKLGDQTSLFKSTSLDTDNLLNLLSSKNTSQDNNLHYELFYSKDLSSSQDIMKIADIDRRISKLEKLIGPDSELPDAHGILATVRNLKNDMGKLNEDSILTLNHQLTNVINQHNEIHPTENQTEISSDVQSKIDSLFESTQQLTNISSELSYVVNRLVQLKMVHLRAAELTSQLQSISNLQATTKNMVEKNIEYLKKMEDGLSANVNIIQVNMKKIEEKISQ